MSEWPKTQMAYSHWQHQVLDYGLWTDQVFCIGTEPHPRQ